VGHLAALALGPAVTPARDSRRLFAAPAAVGIGVGDARTFSDGAGRDHLALPLLRRAGDGMEPNIREPKQSGPFVALANCGHRRFGGRTMSATSATVAIWRKPARSGGFSLSSLIRAGRGADCGTPGGGQHERLRLLLTDQPETITWCAPRLFECWNRLCRSGRCVPAGHFSSTGGRSSFSTSALSELEAGRDEQAEDAFITRRSCTTHFRNRFPAHEVPRWAPSSTPSTR
jgi:hypothetical protein